MQFGKFLFPYPVLRPNDDSINGRIDFTYEIKESEDDFIIKLNFDIDNDDILQLIRNGKAVYFCDVTSTQTLFRKSFSLSSDQMEIKISKEDLRGKVEIDLMIIAKENIANYKNSQAHEDFQDSMIDLYKGDLLAYFGMIKFEAQIDYRKLRAVSSIMTIKGDRDTETMLINLDDDKIVLKIPMKDYEILRKPNIANDPDKTAIFHASFVFPALLYALYSLKNNEYEDQLWAKTLMYRIENEKEFKDKNLSYKNYVDIPEIAQILLGYPVSRLMEKLDELANAELNNDRL